MCHSFDTGPPVVTRQNVPILGLGEKRTIFRGTRGQSVDNGHRGRQPRQNVHVFPTSLKLFWQVKCKFSAGQLWKAWRSRAALFDPALGRPI